MPFNTQELLDRSRKELLDLSTRNRLLSIPVKSKSARIVEVWDELSEQVYRLLVTEKKSLSFLPGQQTKSDRKAGGSSAQAADDADDEDVGLPQPDDEIDSATRLSKRHLDARLQTSLSPEALQRRLLNLFRDAQSMIEEQGVNILYLALGHLKWFEAEQTDAPRYAPLILVPAELLRKTASERFYLRWREEDLQENLSLEAKLKTDFGIDLPLFLDEENLSPTNYFDAVTKAIAGAKGWEVVPNAITLGFFSFAKFLMYRDLDSENWPEGDMLLKHPFITGLLQDGFPQGEPMLSEDTFLDELIPVSRLDHVVDADSSQTLAIEGVRQGRSAVIQGPPGTGKSQSITNIIANGVFDGKRILFVAEKLAALEVVKRRLEREGLGPLCLELHSNKANKRDVIQEIGRTWQLGRPKAADVEALIPKLEQSRAFLNNHAASMHERHSPSGLTPFVIMGQLVGLGNRGRDAADIVFPDVESWTEEDRIERRKLCEELVARVEQIGPPSQHPWRGVCREMVLNIDLDPIERRIRSLIARLDQLRETSVALASMLSQPIAGSFVEVAHLRVIAEYVAKAPAVDKQALCNGVWNTGLDGLRDLLTQGQTFANALTQVGNRVTDSTWEKDFSDIRTHITARGRSWFRFLNGNYRRSVAGLRGALTGELPQSYANRLALVDQIIAGQRALRGIRDSASTGESAFGALWHREKTDWSHLEVVLNWVARQSEAGLDASFRQMFSGVQNPQGIAQLGEQLSTRFTAAHRETEQLWQELTLDCATAFGVADMDQVQLETIAQRCSLWLLEMEALLRWNNYFVRCKRARELGLSSLVERLENGTVQPNAVIDCFDRIYFAQLLRCVIRQKPELSQFDGVLHDSRVAEFRYLDKERLALARYRTLISHFERMPPLNSGVGPAGIVRSEMERKRGHRTVRRLLKDAGSVVQAIKPVFMMSPLSVAQFLESGAVEFDLLVIDEASQVQPVDALGAIARCKQIVVVGDGKQLPPTRFFTRLTTESAEPDDDADTAQVAEAKDIESILGLCCARGLPQTMLRWHYRSRHHSLIAVSNREFYENRLFIVPSPYSAVPNLGLKFNYIPEGVFDSGGSGTNRVEAKVICRAIIEHVRKSPHLSLGVAAFSLRQQQAILDELELLRRENPETEGFFSGHPTEPFFVKNLEKVQGDERDVIFISVGYGKDVHGYMAMRFGPLSNEGGERRLNVLISRAKERCEVFSSITADDIDLNRAGGRGVVAFKAFLSFAQTGRLAIAEHTGREEQSPFEEAVRGGLESLGYEIHSQVGIAGFFIDLAVVDRDRPGRYLLGIECDGAPYHSSRSARDRDRLRQAVLEDHGWIIHRIWSTDWFQRPAEQLRKVADAIERAKVNLDEVEHHAAPSVSPNVTVESEDRIEREAVLDINSRELSNLATPYQEARFTVPKDQDPHELGTKQMAEIILLIVEQESPIHEDEVVTRVRELWDLGRAGARIQDAVAKGVRSLLVTGKFTREDGFLSIPSSLVPIRNRETVSSPNLRKPDMLPPSEIRAAIMSIIGANHGATKAEIPVAVARLFGFKSTSSQLRILIEKQVAKMLRAAVVEETNGMLKLCTKNGAS
jgi:very-short-patch-repair endonuclease